MKFGLILSAVLIVTGCSGSSGSGGTSAFAGTWLDDSIVEFKNNPTPQFICNNLEIENGERELLIDGFEINQKGGVADFQLNGVGVVAWKVKNDGTVYDDLIMQNKDSIEGAEDLLAHRMKKISDNEIANIWTLKVSGGGSKDSELIYVRMTPEEIATIKAIVKNCP